MFILSEQDRALLLKYIFRVFLSVICTYIAASHLVICDFAHLQLKWPLAILL